MPCFIKSSFSQSLKKIFFAYLLIYFWLHWVFVAACGLSLVVASGGAPLHGCVWASHCGGFSCRAQALGAWASVLAEQGLSSCGSPALEHGLSGLWRTGLVVQWHVEFSPTGDRTHVPCIGRHILLHCATREALSHRSSCQLCVADEKTEAQMG